MSPPPAPTEKKPKGAAPAPPVRGKKGKLKKMKKYADQDEDERLLRLAALGHVKVSELTESVENDKVDVYRQSLAVHSV